MAATAGEIAGLIQFGATTGKEALGVLNKWMDSKQTAQSWYGIDYYEDFVRPTPIKRLWRQHLTSEPEIQMVCTMKKDH